MNIFILLFMIDRSQEVLNDWIKSFFLSLWESGISNIGTYNTPFCSLYMLKNIYL